MNKIALMLTTLVVAGYFTFKMTDAPNQDTIVWTDGARIDEECLRYQCFRQTHDEAVEGLITGEISLEEAQLRVHDAALRFRPEFIEAIAFAEPGNTVAERVAHNLVGHVRSAAEMKSHLGPRVPLLEIELRALKNGYRARLARP